MPGILVPTDFSDDASNASHYAAQLAAKMNATLTLLHAYMLPTPVSEVPYVMVNAELIQEENELAAKAEAEKLTKAYGISVTSIVRLGFPSEEIEVLIENTRIDLVVMGMKGQGTLEKIVGSTTTTVLKKIRKPLIIVPENARFTEIKQMTYATDYSYPINYSAYEPLKQLQKLFNAQLNIVHVRKKGEALVSGELQLEPVFKDCPHQYFTIEDTDVKHGIESFLKTHATDLLIMVTHEHGFWERIFGKSHTKDMVYHTHIPLMVLKDRKS